MNIKLSKEFLTELQNNAYHGIQHEDVVDHIAMVLEMLDLINIPGVDSHQLRIKVFPLSLIDDARQWWINEGEGKITTWEELVEKFFCKFYPESYNGEEEMLDEGNNWGIDPLELISRVNSSFKNHRRVDGRTKKETDIQEKEQKESQTQTNPSTGRKGPREIRSQTRKRRQQQVPPNLVEPSKDTMADNRTMAELLQAPTEGYEDAIVVPEIAAANFEIKHGLLTLVQNKQFFGHDKEDPHAHIRYFNKITSTLRYPNVPTTSIKLMLFPFSLEGAARIWLKKEP
ncbi:hypothetical protein Tco_0556529 [Tanacetum coccineum]